MIVFQAESFETGEPATWGTGDWNGDGAFDSSDFVTAFIAGGYEQGQRAAVAAVPEPSSLIGLAIGALALGLLRRRK